MQTDTIPMCTSDQCNVDTDWYSRRQAAGGRRQATSSKQPAARNKQ